MIDALPAWVAIPVALLLVASGFLTLTGSLGLLRLPTFYTRIHAPTLGNTLGVFGVLLASILVSSTVEERYVVHQILITVFLVITSPVTAMLLMRAAIKRQKPSAAAVQAPQEDAGAAAAPRAEDRKPDAPRG
ncbi:monovalent cation/H(+) antiporter subunit G [Pollutimonas sp. M17]|uniref:monovalent cation/H(+) antiporter subunit G n=1 Tax=Pollutimonas sp. M17 TaxID=2962065 RepID=UPI0021F47597|nr:monovalent cation/H(+) antiporter subunit G [Pollutimonas sp. M17]UYO95066.1 monovalent cation/H(+) antiporter subunit G [Pollutimonas sp. M17]